MPKVDTFVIHDDHRRARQEHSQWVEDIARWREEHRRAATILEAVKVAWEKAEATLEEHARKIQTLQQHLDRHEQILAKEGWAVEVCEAESMVSDHLRFQAAHAEACKVHEEMQQLYVAVAAEVFELLKLTHPDAVVQETN